MAKFTIKHNEAIDCLAQAIEFITSSGKVYYPELVDAADDISVSEISVDGCIIPNVKYVPVDVLYISEEIIRHWSDDFDTGSKIELVVIAPNGAIESWMMDAEGAAYMRLTDIINCPTGWLKVSKGAPYGSIKTEEEELEDSNSSTNIKKKKREF